MAKIINFYNTEVSVENSKVMQKWLNLSEELKQKLINNVVCSVCGMTTIIDYIVVPNEYYCDVVLKGKCKHCGKEVARLVEL
ncbi:MAG: hypothetical protein M1576_01640 [Deltaproteobacteria bacterium]|jgi:hypothetical protein|nr:hypothetical protein [Deltaproteobacteria bacterium]